MTNPTVSRAACHGVLVFGFLAMAVAGCQEAVDPAVMRERDKYLLDDEPSGAIGVVEAREKITDQQETDVILIGRVGAGEQSTWDPGKAAFVVRDPAAAQEAHEHEEGHDPDNCPFCKAEKERSADMTALVKVVDGSGEVVAIDARKLLPIKRDQLVVVRGVAQLDALGNLVVAADGVYIRR